LDRKLIIAMHELSKKEKKTAREIIGKGLQAEFNNGILRCKKILDNWNPEAADHRETYHTLYKTLTEFDKHIAFRYDGITGSKYLQTIAGQLYDKVINIEDLKEFSQETQNVIIQISNINTEL